MFPKSDIHVFYTRSYNKSETFLFVSIYKCMTCRSLKSSNSDGCNDDDDNDDDFVVPINTL